MNGPIFVLDHVKILEKKMKEFFPKHNLLAKSQFLKMKKTTQISSKI